MPSIAAVAGERIRSLRLQKKLSQDALSELANLHGKYIGQLERGEKNATLESIEKVARALGVSFETLFANIVTGETKNETAAQCYDMVAKLPPKEQQAIYELLKTVAAYKKL